MLWCLLCALAGKGRVEDADDHDRNDNYDGNSKDGNNNYGDDIYIMVKYLFVCHEKSSLPNRLS